MQPSSNGRVFMSNRIIYALPYARSYNKVILCFEVLTSCKHDSHELRWISFLPNDIRLRAIIWIERGNEELAGAVESSLKRDLVANDTCWVKDCRASLMCLLRSITTMSMKQWTIVVFVLVFLYFYCSLYMLNMPVVQGINPAETNQGEEHTNECSPSRRCDLNGRTNC